MRLFDEIFGAITMGAMELENAFTGNGGYSTTSKGEGKFASESEDIYCPDEVEKKLNDIFDSDSRSNISDYSKMYSRAIRGWRISAHVCAYLSCKEGLHDDWNKEYMVASNILCDEFGVPRMYKDVSTGNLKIRDYGINSGRPIILASTVAEAIRRFPCESFIRSIKEDNKVEVVKPSEVITANNKVILLPAYKHTIIDHRNITPKYSVDDEALSNDLQNQMDLAMNNVENIVDRFSNKMIDEMEYSTNKVEFIMNGVIDKVLDEMQFNTDRIESMMNGVIDQMRGDSLDSESAVKAIISAVTGRVIDEMYNIARSKKSDTDDLQAEVELNEESNADDSTPCDADQNSGYINDTGDGCGSDIEPDNDTSSVSNNPYPLPRSPIIKYNSDKFVIPQESGNISQSEKKRFERTFGKFLIGKKYTLKKNIGGAINCTIHWDDGTSISHIIDPCLAVGDEYYVVVPTIGFSNSTVMVHPSEEEILKKVFNSKDISYRLTEDEHQRVLSHMFLNLRIYTVFDMSNMGSNILKLKADPASFKKFGQKLTFIINCIDNTPKLGRLRFSRYQGIDNFEVRSSNSNKYKVRSPFPRETLEYLSGVVIEVIGDDVTVQFEGESTKYTIDKYGVM